MGHVGADRLLVSVERHVHGVVAHGVADVGLHQVDAADVGQLHGNHVATGARSKLEEVRHVAGTHDDLDVELAKLDVQACDEVLDLVAQGMVSHILDVYVQGGPDVQSVFGGYEGEVVEIHPVLVVGCVLDSYKFCASREGVLIERPFFR